jgi:hypothetical protein
VTAKQGSPRRLATLLRTKGPIDIPPVSHIPAGMRSRGNVSVTVPEQGSVGRSASTGGVCDHYAGAPGDAARPADRAPLDALVDAVEAAYELGEQVFGPDGATYLDRGAHRDQDRTTTERARQPKQELDMGLRTANMAGDDFGRLLPQHLIDKGCIQRRRARATRGAARAIAKKLENSIARMTELRCDQRCNPGGASAESGRGGCGGLGVSRPGLLRVTRQPSCPEDP